VQNKFYQHTEELRKLPIEIRNRVRAILAVDRKEAIRLVNKIRKRKTTKEIILVENALNLCSYKNEPLVPSGFPTAVQTREEFYRLENLGLLGEFNLIVEAVKQSSSRLLDLIRSLRTLNLLILMEDFREASINFQNFFENYGYSHLLLRKAVLIKSMSSAVDISEVENFLNDAGTGTRQIILSSLMSAFNEDQDMLGLKRSMMNLPNRGVANQFTRDMCRIAFHPFAKDEPDLSEMLQSNRQSSLIDALLIVNTNLQFLSGTSCNVSSLYLLLSEIRSCDFTIDDIAANFDSDDQDAEYIFYKRSSAWLENSEIILYRNLIDKFYDAPDSDYINIDFPTMTQAALWAKDLPLSELATSKNLTNHEFPNLRRLENNGMATRSALFNYQIQLTSGFTHVEESALLEIMGITRDLPKTVNSHFLSNLAKVSLSPLSQLTLYFLIAKKTRSESDDHKLRKLFQKITLDEHGGSIVALLDWINNKSHAVAVYAYEVCTEDFIAKLFHIIKSSSEITETRASLHKWMGNITGERAYLDRARTLLIDHQLNKIRNEIDDNRIYVDSARFAEWINDEIIRDANAILTANEHKHEFQPDVEDPQLVSLVEKCYVSFCSNKIFGIASYLGRRIRHGTFKGHLYSGVISIERDQKYKNLLAEPLIQSRWIRWKAEYEKKIDLIIQNRLHIESSIKRDGLLRPSSANIKKYDAVAACSRTIARDYSSSKSTSGIPIIVTEYCWRIAEFDLKEINGFLKNQKLALVNNELLSEIKSSAGWTSRATSGDFCKELVRAIDERFLTLYTWFKRPANVAPKASLSLLYKAVVAEVQEAFPEFNTSTAFEEDSDVEIAGGAYHIIYDSFYVIIYNAAKHGKIGAELEREFRIFDNPLKRGKILSLSVTSMIRDSDDEFEIAHRLIVNGSEDVSDAQVSEDRSGIRKLYHLEQLNKNFVIGEVACRNRQVSVSMMLDLEH
jgi:hypothetical protein